MTRKINPGEIILIVFVACLMFMIARDYRTFADLGPKSASWPSTQGRIQRSKVSATGEGSYADIEYQYAVHGKVYTSTRVLFGDDQAERLVARFKENADVNVYYDPANPSSAVLIPGYGPGNDIVFWITTILGSLVTLVPVAWVLKGRMFKNAKQEDHA